MSTTATLILILIFVTMAILAPVPFVMRARQRRAASSGVDSPAGLLRTPRTRPSALSVDLASPPAAALPETGSPSDTKEVRPPADFAVGLGASRRSLRDRLASIRGRQLDAEVWESLTEALLGADVGAATTMATLDRLRSATAELKIADSDGLLIALGEQMRAALDADRSLATTAPCREGATPVWLFVGVNGVGKTTTIGKVGHRFSSEGRRVVMAAGDTFRAAATSQLQTWADRCGAELISGSEGADPSSVVHAAIAAAAARGADVVLADTAGRLQTRKNLMEELAKVRRVADREPGAVAETLLVIDATTGQNGLSQARAFADATDVTGVVLTKLDGSAKGGIVFAIESELGLAVKLVGLGEHADDLIDFDPASYIDALLGVGGTVDSARGE